MKAAVRDAVELCRLLRLPPQYEASARRAARLFPPFVPRTYLARIRPGDPHDPLLRQVLPLADELADVPGYTADPVADEDARLTAGLLQKYRGRVLMVTTGACAVHCRYCFRRHYPYDETPKGAGAWDEALGHIRADTSLREVLLSGGDPLALVDDQLAELAGRLAAIPHLRRLRVHTRLPVMIPQRVTGELIAWLRGTRLATVVVMHANHPAELDDTVGDAVARLVDAGIPVLNQAVLLRGVNDDVPTLAALCERLVDLRAMPYYLHQLDRVAGAAHFEVPIARGRELIAGIRRLLPGYAVPRYVQEVAGAEHKIVLSM
jgi:EF-P beta-lysylation protein EpmB